MLELDDRASPRLVFVKGVSGAVGQEFDPDDDAALGSIPWITVVSQVGT